MNKCNINKCKAACCGIVPIPKGIFLKHKHLIDNVDYMTVEKEILPQIKGIVIPIKAKDDPECAFLTDEYKCLIYNDRPEICRKFGDPKETHILLQCKYLINGGK